MKELPIHIIELLIAYDQNKLDKVGHKQLADWLKENPNEHELAKKYLHLSNNLQMTRVFEQINVESAWQSVSQLTSIKPGWEKVKTLMVMKYAASILLPILAVVSILWYLSVNDSLKRTVSNNNIELEPGSAKAILKLHDGENIVLGAGDNEVVNLNDGSVLAKDSLDVLSYMSIATKKVQLNSLLVPKGGEYKLVLVDGTKVWLNSETKLSYPTRFEGNNRTIHLLQGEIYLEVIENSDKPFVVKGNDYEIQVLGTGFNVRNYHDEQGTIITLVHGSVKVSKESKGESLVLKPDQQVRFINNSISVQNVIASEAAGWIEGVLYYNNASLEEILRDLSRWYNFKYEFEEKEIANMRFGGGIYRYEEITKILDIISLTNKLEISVEGKLITFSKK